MHVLLCLVSSNIYKDLRTESAHPTCWIRRAKNKIWYSIHTQLVLWIHAPWIRTYPLSYTGSTRRNTLFIFLLLRRRNTCISIQHVGSLLPPCKLSSCVCLPCQVSINIYKDLRTASAHVLMAMDSFVSTLTTHYTQAECPPPILFCVVTFPSTSIRTCSPSLRVNPLMAMDGDSCSCLAGGALSCLVI